MVTQPEKKSKVWSLLKKRQRRDRNFKYRASLALFILFAVTSIFAASPGSLKDSVFQKIGLQEKFSTDFQEDQRQFKFLDTSDNGVPAYFKGCGSINYYVRPNYMGAEDLSIISTALSKIGNGLGRPFVFKGITQKKEASELPDSVLINFASVLEYKALDLTFKEDHVESLGRGGPTAYFDTDKPRFGSLTATSGTIWINQKYWPDLPEDGKINTVMHEMGHVLGLDHPVDGQNQIMDTGSYYVTSLGTGDLMGLKILSALAGCGKFPKYLTGSNIQQEESVTKFDQDAAINDVYSGVRSELGWASLNRALISSAQNSCGNNFPESVQKLNSKIPSTWTMREYDGCGSGRSYIWEGPSSGFVVLEFSGSSGWCQTIAPDDVDGIATELLGDNEVTWGLDFFGKIESDSGRFIYEYSSVVNSIFISGAIEVGSAYQWCDGGSMKIEVGSNGPTDDEFFTRILTTVFGQF